MSTYLISTLTEYSLLRDFCVPTKVLPVRKNEEGIVGSNYACFRFRFNIHSWFLARGNGKAQTRRKRGGVEGVNRHTLTVENCIDLIFMLPAAAASLRLDFADSFARASSRSGAQAVRLGLSTEGEGRGKEDDDADGDDDDGGDGEAGTEAVV